MKKRNSDFQTWLAQRMEELADTPKGQLIAKFDTLEEWFATPGYSGCMFIKASSEFQDAKYPIPDARLASVKLVNALKFLSIQVTRRDA